VGCDQKILLVILDVATLGSLGLKIFENVFQMAVKILVLGLVADIRAFAHCCAGVSVTILSSYNKI